MMRFRSVSCGLKMRILLNGKKLQRAGGVLADLPKNGVL